MKTITINGKTYKARGASRQLIGERVERAMRNAARPHFNEKYIHPRSRRVHASQKP